MGDDQGVIGSFLPVGTKVRLFGSGVEGGEVGIVVHCWLNEEIKGYDCSVVFFGSEFPSGRPEQLPYVLRYAASSLDVVSA